MDLDLATILVFLTGLLAGGVAALKVIAPRTKTTKDDKVLEVLEKAEEFLPHAAAKPKT